MLLLQIPLHCVDTDFFTTLLTQVLQEEEICCHKTLAKFQCQVLLLQISSQLFFRNRFCKRKKFVVNLFGNRIGKNWKSQAKQSSAHTAFGKKAAPASFSPFLPPSLPPFSSSLLPEWQQQTTIWSRHYLFMDEKSWMWFLSRWRGQAYGLVIWAEEILFVSKV